MGRTDESILESEIERVGPINIVSHFEHFKFYSSPLKRAEQTLSALKCSHFEVEPALIEMDYGDWEGRTVEDIQKDIAPFVNEKGYGGPNFKNHNGESFVECQSRVMEWLKKMDQSHEENIFGVTHKGVLQSLIGIATGWDYWNKPPSPVSYDKIFEFEFNNYELKFISNRKSLESL